METGIGKTYVYLRTIFELNAKYGWQKFVIVVLVWQFGRACYIHWKSLKRILPRCLIMLTWTPNLSISNQLSRLKQFAQNHHIEILVINIDAFAKDSNVINTINESGEAPISIFNKCVPLSLLTNRKIWRRRFAVKRSKASIHVYLALFSHIKILTTPF